MASGEISTVDSPEKLSMTFVHNWHITDRYFPRIRNFNLDQVSTVHVSNASTAQVLDKPYIKTSGLWEYGHGQSVCWLFQKCTALLSN